MVTSGYWRRFTSLILAGLLVAALFGFVDARSPETATAAPLASFVLDDGSYAYDFFGVQGAAIRGKALWASTSVDCGGGGAAIPGGKVIMATGVDQPGRRVLYWVYPPGTDSVISVSFANAAVQDSPPTGWGSTGKPQPVQACSLFRPLGNNTYRLTSMFVASLGPGNGYALALLDSGINLVVTPLP